MSAWRWLFAWFGEPERPPQREGGRLTGATAPGWKEAGGGSGTRGRPASSRRARRPLPQTTRDQLERALGADLAALSLTIDPAFTAALDARAVQLGSTIVLGDAADARSLPLLAHEAAHALQAQRRGTRPGIGRPGDAGEQAAARTGAAVASGGAPPPGSAGPPVAAIQRQPAVPGATKAAGARDPATLRAMLMVAYARQGGQGDLAWSADLAAAFRHLLPDVALARLELLWQPPPKGPDEAMARLEGAGLLAPSPAPAAPEAVPETPASMPEPAEKTAPPLEPERAVEEPAPPPLMEGARKALDVTLVVTLPDGLPPALVQAAPALRRGFRLDQRQLRALRTDRSRARQVYDELLAGTSLDANARAALAELLADLAWQSSVAAHGAAPSAPATGPGLPWRTVAGGLVAAAPFADLLAALAACTVVSATLRFRP